jgi:glycosyltransferase involved in cell wall biosynthesis
LNITFFQYGDFGEAFRRLRGGGAETYRDQKSSVDFVASLRARYAVTTAAICDRDHKEILEHNLGSVGIAKNSAYRAEAVNRLLNDLAPALIVCRTPNRHVVRWARKHAVPTLPTFADFFSNRGPRDFLRNMTLRAQLDPRIFPCVANHNLNASISVSKALFYPKSRIIPWDWSRLAIAEAAKTAPADMKRPSAFFAGALTVEKGVGDCLEAIALLRQRGVAVSFVFAGPGNVDAWCSRAKQLGIADRVQFVGMISNAEVRRRMVESDIVIVPSRHDYDEGLPNTIYEALASRTPLLISDHPAFARRLHDGDNCLIFRAADAASMASRISRVLMDEALFARLSARSAAAHEALYFGMDWKELVTTFLDDPHNKAGWVQANSLTALQRRRDMA